MENKHTRRGFTQNIQWVGETLSHKDNLASSPLVGEVARSAEGGSAIKEHLLNTLLPRLTAILPPQGREIKAQGFTLIELLVVVLIIGILAAVAVPQYQKAVEKARMTEAVILVRIIANAHQLYYLENGEYLTAGDIDKLTIEIPGTSDATITEGRIRTKDFIYSPNGSGDGPYLAVARRIKANETDEDNPYWIGIRKTDPGTIRCVVAGHGNATNVQRILCNQLNEKGIL